MAALNLSWELGTVFEWICSPVSGLVLLVSSFSSGEMQAPGCSRQSGHPMVQPSETLGNICNFPELPSIQVYQKDELSRSKSCGPSVDLIFVGPQFWLLDQTNTWMIILHRTPWAETLFLWMGSYKKGGTVGGLTQVTVAVNRVLN